MNIHKHTNYIEQEANEETALRAQISEYVEEFTRYEVNCSGCGASTGDADDQEVVISGAISLGFKDATIGDTQGLYCIECRNGQK